MVKGPRPKVPGQRSRVHGRVGGPPKGFAITTPNTQEYLKTLDMNKKYTFTNPTISRTYTTTTPAAATLAALK